MIRYALTCEKGHGFDGWFRNSGAYDEQARNGQIECPQCGSKKVAKALMAPGIATSEAKENHNAGLLEEVRRARRELLKDAENVGDDFAAEARKIHYKESDGRRIYGRATDQEAKSLREEGVDFVPLPALPEDKN